MVARAWHQGRSSACGDGSLPGFASACVFHAQRKQATIASRRLGEAGHDHDVRPSAATYAIRIRSVWRSCHKTQPTALGKNRLDVLTSSVFGTPFGLGSELSAPSVGGPVLAAAAASWKVRQVSASARVFCSSATNSCGGRRVIQYWCVLRKRTMPTNPDWCAHICHEICFPHSGTEATKIRALRRSTLHLMIALGCVLLNLCSIRGAACLIACCAGTRSH